MQPEIVISTDIITGFVNETEAEHQETIKLLEDAQFDFIYSYAYSLRPGTRAAKMEDSLTKDIRKSRLHEVQAKQNQIQAKIRKTMVGQTYRVLVEGHNTFKGEKKWKGRSNCNRIIHFEPENEDSNYQWHWVDVKVNDATTFSCQGDLITDHDRVISKGIQ